MHTMNENKGKILIAEIVSAVGIKGEIKIKSHAENVSEFKDFDHVFVSLNQGAKSDDAPSSFEIYHIEKVREMGNMAAIKFAEIDDRNTAETLIKGKIYIDEAQLAELPDDTYYVRDLIGLDVLNLEEISGGEADLSMLDNDAIEKAGIGVITDVIQNTAQDIYVIKLNDDDSAPPVMVPAVKEFIKEVNIKDGYVVISFIEGMLP